MEQRQTAIINGASSGIGRAVATLLAAEGFDLALVARRIEALEETADLAKAQRPGTRTLLLACDLCDASAAQAVPQRAAERFGRIDAIANVAGYAHLGPLTDTTPELWARTIDANLSYIVHSTAAAWPVFERQQGGVIVNVSSMSSIDPFPGFSAYAAAKAGVNMFTHCTAQEGEAIGVRAVCVAPGAVETAMLRSLFDEATVPRDAALTPEAVGQVIVELIVGRRTFKSGETIPVQRS